MSFFVAGAPTKTTNKLVGEAETNNISSTNIEVLYEWKIRDFFSFTEKYKDKYFDSPAFSFTGCSSCNWVLRLHPYETSGCISLYLCCINSNTRGQDIAYSFAIKKPDGKLEETTMQDSTFKGGFSVFGSKDLWSRDDLLRRQSELLLFDALTITCRLKNRKFQNEEVASQQLKLMELETLSLKFGDLLKSKDNFDVIIKAKDKEFQAHRAVLVARSQVFAAMFKHDLSEKETGVIDIEDSDPESFGDFLHYLYTGVIESMSFRNAYHLYVTAHKYDVKELKSFCVTYMRNNLTVKNFCDVTIIADQYDETSLMDSAQIFFHENVCDILSTVKWEMLMKNHSRLANSLFKQMASTYKRLISIWGQNICTCNRTE